MQNGRIHSAFCILNSAFSMKILVANLGSTSFKYRLFDMRDEKELARGGVERIGAPESKCPDHAIAVRMCLQQLTDDKCLTSPKELAAIGFKAVHARGITGVHRVDEKVLQAMEAYNNVAHENNPPYVNAMRLLAKELPEINLVDALASGFLETILS